MPVEPWGQFRPDPHSHAIASGEIADHIERLLVTRDPTEVVELTARVVASPVVDQHSLLQLAIIAREAGLFAQTNRLLEHLLFFFPENTHALYELGLSRSRQGRFVPAIAALDSALRIDPTDARSNLLAGRLLHLMGDGAQARERLSTVTAAQVDPSALKIELDYGRYLLARPYLAASQLARRLEATRFLSEAQLGARLQASLDSGSGFSVIRLGDGEGAFLPPAAGDPSCPDLYAYVRRDRARVWFDGEIDPDPSGFTEEMAGLADVIRRADVIGAPYASWIDHEYEILSTTGVPTLVNILHFLDQDPTARGVSLARQTLHVDMESAGVLEELLRGRDHLQLISCHAGLAPRLAARYGIGSVEQIRIPGEKAHRHLLGAEASAGVHYPDVFRETMVRLERPSSGELTLVAAGILGKFYCDRIKASGGVALDVGSLVDQWMGAATRPLHDSSRILSSKPKGESLELEREVPVTNGSANESLVSSPEDKRAALESLIEGVLGASDTTILDGSFVAEIGPYVESEQISTLAIHDLLRAAREDGKVDLLDFGCGSGGHRSMLEGFGFDWHGIDYSPTVAPEAAEGERLRFYDGKNIPFGNGSFDIVYSFLVFEHIQDIHKTFAEIQRVLRPGGVLVGQVAYLEQVHDYSTFNFTPIGMKLACEASGLQLQRIYPSFDVFGFLMHRLAVVASGSDETPFLSMMTTKGVFHDCVERRSLSNSQKNLLKLMFSAHFLFKASNL